MKILTARYIKGVVKPEPPENDDAPEIGFIGRSNVGKSSMINKLVMQKVAKTSSTPGATRIINLYRIEYEYKGGKRSATFSDFPGFGYAKVPRKMYQSWQEMIEAYVRENERIRKLVWVYDVRRELDDLDRSLIDWLDSMGMDFLLVLTKIDKETRSAVAKKKALMSRYFRYEQIITFSAKDGDGRKELLSHLFAVSE
jgi:GTP-binding protein